MKPDMIQATLDLRKTVTRRLSGLKEINQEPDKWVCSGKDLFYHLLDKTAFIFHHIETREERIIRPRYQVGETVYIKEAMVRIPRIFDEVSGYHTEATYSDGMLVTGINWVWKHDILSPMFLPEACARYFIKIKAVSAERVQEITENDCYLEGIEPPHKRYDGVDRATLLLYQYLWDSINPAYPFESNPFVWVYSFEMVDKPVGIVI